VPEQQEGDQAAELVQCPQCLGYFTQQREGDLETTEKSIERHTCYVGGRAPQP
jgi:hypothetical protein